jgi:hypothetical protein
MSGDNVGAEKVFREDLDRNPEPALFGLGVAKSTGQNYDAGFVTRDSAWRGRVEQQIEIGGFGLIRMGNYRVLKFRCVIKRFK